MLRTIFLLLYTHIVSIVFTQGAGSVPINYGVYKVNIERYTVILKNKQLTALTPTYMREYQLVFAVTLIYLNSSCEL